MTYQIGVFNGVVDGGSADIDDHSGKDVVARVFAHPFRKAQSDTWKQLGVGFAVSSGSQRGTVATPDLPTYRTAAQQTFFRYRSDSDAGGHDDCERRSLAGRSAGVLLPRTGRPAGRVLASATRSCDAAWSPATTRQRRGSSKASYVLTGEDASYRGVTPRRSFERSTGGKGWGAFELIGRYGRFRGR